MTITAKRILPGLAVALAGAAIVLAPLAGADSSPLVPYGTNPHVGPSVGLHSDDQDEINTTAGILDLPF